MMLTTLLCVGKSKFPVPAVTCTLIPTINPAVLATLMVVPTEVALAVIVTVGSTPFTNHL